MSEPTPVPIGGDQPFTTSLGDEQPIGASIDDDIPMLVPLDPPEPVPVHLGGAGPVPVDLGGFGGSVPGPPGPPGPTVVSTDPGNAATLGTDHLIYVPKPEGFMEEAVYDPRGKRDDSFQLENMTGVLDGGIFT